MLTAERRPAIVDGAPIDVGQVGDVVDVDPATVHALIDAGRIPVIATVARGTDGLTYNVNADTAAAAVAVGLGAEKLVVLTDVEGLYADWPASTEVISQIGSDELATLLPGLSSGMVPKMEACLRAVEGGVPRAHVLDGRVPHALLLEIFTSEGVGTMVLPSKELS
jgi:acetylglutamate kinase